MGGFHCNVHAVRTQCACSADTGPKSCSEISGVSHMATDLVIDQFADMASAVQCRFPRVTKSGLVHFPCALK